MRAMIMSIHELGFIFKDLTVIENNNISSPILYLNSKDYKKFHKEFKEYELQPHNNNEEEL
jgi:hypothetical protein